MNNRELGCALLIAALAAGACDKNDKREPSAEAPAAEPPQQQEQAVSAAAPQTPLWPDGWMVVSRDEWIPVMNKAGEALSAARKAFLADDEKTASEHVKAAASAIRNEQGELEKGKLADAEKKRLEDAAKQLEVLAAKLDGEQEVKREEFDTTFTNAYRANAEVDWLHLSTDTMVPLYEKPRTHFKDALQKLEAKDNEGAASEIRRGVAYLRLGLQSARGEDRQQLSGSLDELRQLGNRAEKGELSQADLRSALARVDSAYASSYLERGHDAYARNDTSEAGRSFREAASRMRARLEWLGEESKEAAKEVIDELEQAGDQLAKGTKMAGKKLEDLYQRAKRSLASATDGKANDQG